MLENRSRPLRPVIPSNDHPMMVLVLDDEYFSWLRVGILYFLTLLSKITQG